MASDTRPLAVVTGASKGIGFKLARQCVEHGFDVIIASGGKDIEQAAQALRRDGAHVEAIRADLSRAEGVDTLHDAIKGRSIHALLANAGRGLGRGFLDQDPAEWRDVVETNIIGTLLLLQKVGRAMRAAGKGRILITGSIAGFMPGTYQAVYNGSKAFLDSFAFALRHERAGSGVTVTCLMPGATETDFFDTADMKDTRIAQSKKEHPATVAKTGFEAMMSGRGEVLTGWANKLRAAIAHVAPADMVAEVHRSMAQPQSQPAA